MDDRGERATKNHRKYTFLAVFVQFLVRCNGEFIRAQGAALIAGMFRQLSFQYVPRFFGRDSGIRTPDLRIMMKIVPIFVNKINGLDQPNPTV